MKSVQRKPRSSNPDPWVATLRRLAEVCDDQDHAQRAAVWLTQANEQPPHSSALLGEAVKKTRNDSAARADHRRRADVAVESLRDRGADAESGTRLPTEMAEPSVAVYAALWLQKRSSHGGKALRGHVLSRVWFARLPMADVQWKHILRLIAELNGEKELTPKRVTNIATLVRVMFRDAAREEVVVAALVEKAIREASLRVYKLSLGYHLAEARSRGASPDAARARTTLSTTPARICRVLLSLADELSEIAPMRRQKPRPDELRSLIAVTLQRKRTAARGRPRDLAGLTPAAAQRQRAEATAVRDASALLRYLGVSGTQSNRSMSNQRRSASARLEMFKHFLRTDAVSTTQAAVASHPFPGPRPSRRRGS